MILSSRRHALALRRTVGIVVALVLALLLLAPSAGACTASHERAAAPVAMHHGEMDGMTDCGAPAEPAPVHEGCGDGGGQGCPVSHSGRCALMPGCTVVAFEVPPALSWVPAAIAHRPLVAVQHALLRPRAPELPPPRA